MYNIICLYIHIIYRPIIRSIFDVDFYLHISIDQHI